MLLSDNIYGCLKSRFPLANQLLWIEDQAMPTVNSPNKSNITSTSTTGTTMNSNNSSNNNVSSGAGSNPLNVNASPSFAMSEQFQSMNINSSTHIAGGASVNAAISKNKKPLQFNASLADLIRYACIYQSNENIYLCIWYI